MNSARVRISGLLLLLPVLHLALFPHSKSHSASPTPRKLLLALSSTRERSSPAFAIIYFYQHDGVSERRIVGSVTPEMEMSDYGPSLSGNGKTCAYLAKKAGGTPGSVKLWDVKAKKPLELPAPDKGFGVPAKVALVAGANILSFCSHERPGGAGGWDIFLYDLTSKQIQDAPGLNTAHDEREPALSGNGRYLAYVSSRPEGKGLADVYVYDRSSKAGVDLPGLNTRHRELNPALSADGRWVAFVSDRPGGAGGKDVYLYDRQARDLVPLPGLNSPGHEQSPALAGDGRFLAFVSERTGGAGERDIYLYDREAGRLLPTPALNSKHDDFDPSLVYLEE